MDFKFFRPSDLESTSEVPIDTKDPAYLKGKIEGVESSTGYENLEPILGRAVTDPAFREQLAHDRDAALVAYELTEEEHHLLSQINPEQLEQMAEELQARYAESADPVIQTAQGILLAELLWGSEMKDKLDAGKATLRIHGRVSEVGGSQSPEEETSASMKLPALLRRAVVDDELKRLLFDEPSRAVSAFELTLEEEQRLRKTSRADFEAAVGKFVTYMLLPTPIGERLVIIPLSNNGAIPKDRDQIVLDQSATGANIGNRGISINEGSVFGSGTHPTTRLCVHMLERYLRSGMRVLDLGTGSGILALAAMKLGAGEILGLDVDPHAIPVAESNAERNNLDVHIRFAVGDVNWPASNGIEPFDLVVSNILAEVHIESLEQGLLDSIQQDGHLILSGMYRSDAEKVARAIQEQGCYLIDQASMGRWWVLVAVKGRGG
jgi:ribosomal protein L11 methyltransferase